MNILYNDSVIEIKLETDKKNKALKFIALRYVKPCDCKDKNGEIIHVTNAMGGETDWFILPHTFGAIIGKKLFEQYNAGLMGFNKKNIGLLRDWLIDMAIIDDSMCY